MAKTKCKQPLCWPPGPLLTTWLSSAQLETVSPDGGLPRSQLAWSQHQQWSAEIKVHVLRTVQQGLEALLTIFDGRELPFFAFSLPRIATCDRGDSRLRIWGDAEIHSHKFYLWNYHIYPYLPSSRLLTDSFFTAVSSMAARCLPHLCVISTCTPWRKLQSDSWKTEGQQTMNIGVIYCQQM